MLIFLTFLKGGNPMKKRICALLAILMVVYMIFAQIMKIIYIKRHKDWY